MRVFIVALGSRGDFELGLTLARALRRRGHAVRLGGSPFHALRARGAGIDWEDLGEGRHDDLVALMRSLAPVRDGVQRTREFYARWLRGEISAAMPRITALAIEADYFVNSLRIVVPGPHGPCPGATVTYDPVIGGDDVTRLGAERLDGRILDLMALPRTLVDPDGRWAAPHRFTGFWNADPAPAFRPPAALTEFLARGAPPVVVTMGSMVMFDVRPFVAALVEGVRLAGARAVFVGGWADIDGALEPGDDVLAVGDTPYEWLVPRASAVVHHGGCGTVAAVLRAGRPSILLPQIAAQAEFGRMLLRERLATAMFELEPPDPPRLAAAVRAAVSDERYRTSAARWQTIVAADPGVDGAVSLIEAHAGRLAR